MAIKKINSYFMNTNINEKEAKGCIFCRFLKALDPKPREKSYSEKMFDKLIEEERLRKLNK